MRRIMALTLIVAAFLVSTPSRGDEETDRQLRAIAEVGPGGQGSAAARKARDLLAQQDVTFLPELLRAMDTPNVVAANWYRTVFEDIVARELAEKTPQFPLAELKEYVRDTSHQGRVRRRTLDLIEQLEPGHREAFLGERTDDREFRSDAVALLLNNGKKALDAGQKDEAKAVFRKAFEQARNADQVRDAAGRLAGLGEQVSIVAQMGFITEWWLLGPFDAPEYTGFETVFPPEEKVDLNATYEGQGGAELHWKRHHEKESMGQLNLIELIASTREAVGYAYTEIEVPEAREVQLRCGADDNCSVWLNGEKVFGRNQWLNGTRLDRFVTPVKLRAGRNMVLVKICQGPQHKDPEVPNNWSLQLRFCDVEGKGTPFKSLLVLVEP